MSTIKSFSWEDPDTLIIQKSQGKSRCKSSNFLSGGNKFFHAEIVGDEVHVLTGGKTSSRPNKRHIVNASGVYRGSKGA